MRSLNLISVQSWTYTVSGRLALKKRQSKPVAFQTRSAFEERDNKAVDDTTETMPLAMITKEATGHTDE